MVLFSVLSVFSQLMATEPNECHFISDGKIMMQTNCKDALHDHHRIVLNHNKVIIDDCELDFDKGNVSVTGCLVDQYTIRIEDGGVVVVVFKSSKSK